MLENPIVVNLAVEDDLSEAVLKSCIKQSRRNYYVAFTFRQHGYGYLRKKAAAFNNASKGNPYILLTDLDNASCAPSLIKNWHDAEFHPNFLFRVAVREVESWLLAHRSGFSRFFDVPERLIPCDTDSIPDPKKLILALASESRKRTLRDGIVRIKDGNLLIGPGYNSFLIRFAIQNWIAEEASRHSESLCRMIRAIKKFKPRVES